MKPQSSNQLAGKRCKPCEGGADPYWPQQSQKQLEKLEGWYLVKDGQRIRKDWICGDFMAAMRFLNEVAEVAEAENHHPDLHLTAYKNVAVELYTHAIGGLSENDFILAAKIDRLEVDGQVKTR